MSISNRAILSVISVAAISCAIGNVASTSKDRDPLNNGLIHRWQFDGDANDSVGNLSSIPIGPVAFTDVGYGQGIVFNGSTTGVNFPAQADMLFKGSFSISVWANLHSRPSGSNMWSAIIFEGDDRPGLDPFALQADPNGKIQFLITGANGSAGALEAPMPLNRFVLLTATYDQANGIQSFYEDGKLVSQNTNAKNLTPVCALDNNAKPGIGIGTGNNFLASTYHFGWKGIISDLRIYNRALAPAEAVALFNLGVVRPVRTQNKVINPTP